MPVSDIFLSGATERSVASLITGAGPVAKFILLILLFLSVLCWAVIIMKAIRYARLRKASGAFWATYHADDRLIQSLHDCSEPRHANTPLQNLLFAGVARGYGIGSKPTIADWEVVEKAGRLSHGHADRIERAVDRQALLEMESLESWLPILATTANVSPFFGLFGTVWGVMGAFLSMGSKGSANLAVVGPGIAEALITTLAGLAAAIPAVMAYNHFLGIIRTIQTDLERFRSSLTDRLTRRASDEKA